MTTKMYRLVIEVWENDTTSFTYGASQVAMLNNILEITDINKDLVTMFAPYLPPNTPKTSNLNIALRTGRCFYKDLSRCDTEVYDNPIGFTRQLATSGIDIQMEVILDASTHYVVGGNYGMNTTKAKLIQRMAFQFITTLDFVIISLTTFYDSRSSYVASLFFGLAAANVVLILALFYVGKRFYIC